MQKSNTSFLYLLYQSTPLRHENLLFKIPNVCYTITLVLHCDALTLCWWKVWLRNGVIYRNLLHRLLCMRMVKAKYHAQTQCRYTPYSAVVDAPWPFRRYNLFCNWHYRQPVETNHYVNKFENLLLVMLRVLFFFTCTFSDKNSLRLI